MPGTTPPPWRHPNPATRVAGIITLVVLAIVAVLVLLVVGKLLVVGFAWALSW